MSIAKTPFGFLSYWFSATTPSGNVDPFFTMVGKPIQINHLSGQLQITLLGDQHSADLPTFDNPFPYSLSLYRESGSGALPLDGEWHNMMISWDTQALTIDVYLDGQLMSMDDPNQFSSSTGFDIAYTGGKILIGGDPDSVDYYIGSLAEFYFLAGTKITIDDAVIAKFINTPAPALIG